MSEQALQDIVAWLDAEASGLDSVQLLPCGQLQLELYRNGYGAQDLHELQSATKTWSAVLVGVALDEGLIRELGQPTSELLPEHASLLEGDKADITVRHLLTMTSGLRWQDFGAGNSFTRIAAAEDSVAFVLSEPLDDRPGERFFYNTGSSHLLAAIVQRASGQDPLDYAQSRLFDPMGIEELVWPALQDGRRQGGWGMEVRPSDFAKLGLLLLDEGRWGEQQVISQGFVEAATAAQVETGQGGSYGYQMWIDTHTFEVEDIAGARGHGSQDCFVLEEVDLVVTVTGDIDKPRVNATDVTTLMNELVLPAAQSAD